jgi:23S rRNA pseudouridine1911/1915/1917 synthase
LAHIKYPLVGDATYAGRPRVPRQAEQILVDFLQQFPRQALHARRLKLVHPRTGQSMSWSVPTPDDFIELLDMLQQFDD